MIDEPVNCCFCWNPITDETPVPVRDAVDHLSGYAHAGCLKDAKECAKDKEAAQ